MEISWQSFTLGAAVGCGVLGIRSLLGGFYVWSKTGEVLEGNKGMLDLMFSLTLFAISFSL